ncbi:hypothetical protein NIES4071_16180 [Calothrix sp. NIES-4071]|nr:hypothetical protein NIES4071_16180 [Calothrix sp. NIES-4071]BAZ55952.1 hypothetical protein NIES4105_16130 [Calothrix sp. NIES-4105]
MEPNQQEQRLAADQDFLKSLHELEDILQENAQEDEAPQPEEQIQVPEPDELNIDLAAWEDAVADIEKYFESKQKKDLS